MSEQESKPRGGRRERGARKVGREPKPLVSQQEAEERRARFPGIIDPVPRGAKPT